MGIFSGGFGSGLATGLATSVSKSLTDAMDRREEELSKARVFWQTRQAQKQDQVDAENKRIEKAYTRITNEMGGDAAKGLAAYQAIGGNIDDVEGYLSELTLTQKANMDYSLQDKLDFDKLNLGDYGDFTFDKGFDSIKSELTAPDINYVEAPSLLTAIGLGQDTERVGKTLQQQVEQLVPTSERTDAGIGAATIKGNLYEGTYTARQAKLAEYADTFQKNIIRIESELAELEKGTPEHAKKQEELKRAYDSVGMYNAFSSKVDKDKATVVNLGNAFNNLLRQTDEEISYKDGTATYNGKTYDKAPLEVDGIVTRESGEMLRNSKRLEAAKKFIKLNIELDDKGDVLHSPDDDYGTFLKQNPLAGEALALVQEEIRQANQQAAGTGTEPVIENIEEYVTESLGELDIPNMTSDEIESKKADIIFNATRSVKTPAEDAAVRAQLEEIFVAKGLSMPEEPAEPAEPAEGAVKMSDSDRAKAIADEMLNEPQKFLSGLIENKGRVLTNKEEETLRYEISKLYLGANPTASQMEAGRFASEVFKTYRASDQYAAQLQKEYDSLTPFEKTQQHKSYKKRGVDTWPLGATNEEIAARNKSEQK